MVASLVRQGDDIRRDLEFAEFGPEPSDLVHESTTTSLASEHDRRPLHQLQGYTFFATALTPPAYDPTIRGRSLSKGLVPRFDIEADPAEYEPFNRPSYTRAPMYSTFSGSSRRPRNVNLSGQNTNPFATAWTPSAASSVNKTVSHAQAERQQRQQERDRLKAAGNIQRVWRGYKSRKYLKQSQRETLQALYGQDGGTNVRVAHDALLLLFTVFRPSYEPDQRILSAFLSDLRDSNFSQVHGMPDARLVRLLALVLSSFGSRCVVPKSLALDCCGLFKQC